MSLLFTCPQLTEESSVPAAARMCLHMLCNFYQIESYHSSSSCDPLSMQINGTLILLYFIEMLPRTVSNSGLGGSIHLKGPFTQSVSFGLALASLFRWCICIVDDSIHTEY